jgi:hypothetical protein
MIKEGRDIPHAGLQRTSRWTSLLSPCLCSNILLILPCHGVAFGVDGSKILFGALLLYELRG